MKNYCVFTDQIVPDELGNLDHVIPLSLGGCDELVVWCERGENSRLGSFVDGALSKDPLLSFAIREAGVTGHSGKSKVPTFRKSFIGGEPYQIGFPKDEITYWNAKSKKTCCF